MKRSRIKPVSDKRKAEAPARAAVRQAVFDRDGGCVAAGWHGECFGRLTFHHLQKASQGGTYTEDNGTSLCVRHNDLVETFPNEATAMGLVRRAAA